MYVEGKRKNRVDDTFLIRKKFPLDQTSFDEGRVTASLSDDVLEITVQRRTRPKPRMIPITTTHFDVNSKNTLADKGTSTEKEEIEAALEAVSEEEEYYAEQMTK